MRFHIITKSAGEERVLLAEECQVMGFSGLPGTAAWLDPQDAEKLLEASPEKNVSPEKGQAFLQMILGEFDHIRPYLDKSAHQRAEVLLNAHKRVRTASRRKGISYMVRPQLPADVLGLYVYMPA
jgi:hypothetical protein